MGTTVFPYGTAGSSPLPDYGIGAGIQTAFGAWVPPGSRVIYVSASGTFDGITQAMKLRTRTTLAAALAGCRAGMGDTIFCMPGHTENVVDATMLTNLKAGTRIFGLGRGSNRPTFRWTDTTSQWPVSVADVQISGLRLRLEGANGVVKAIVVTAADFLLQNCDIEMSSGASNKAVIGIEFGAGATRAAIRTCPSIRGTADVVTDPIKIVSAVDGVEITGNRMYCAGTSASGVVHFTAAATNLFVAGNSIDNVTASSIASIGIDSVAATGTIAHNTINVLSTGSQTSNTTGIALGAAALVRCFQNFSANDPRASGMLLPAVDT
jgi:hypothetical protein